VAKATKAKKKKSPAKAKTGAKKLKKVTKSELKKIKGGLSPQQIWGAV
jgi:hypothetical protein